MSRRKSIPTDNAKGQQIADVRKKLKTSQEVLAGKINVSPRQLRRYEQGKNRIPDYIYIEICAELGIRPLLYEMPADTPGGKFSEGQTSLDPSAKSSVKQGIKEALEQTALKIRWARDELERL